MVAVTAAHREQVAIAELGKGEVGARGVQRTSRQGRPFAGGPDVVLVERRVVDRGQCLGAIVAADDPGLVVNRDCGIAGTAEIKLLVGVVSRPQG